MDFPEFSGQLSDLKLGADILNMVSKTLRVSRNLMPIEFDRDSGVLTIVTSNFADNFAGATQSFAEALITELVDFNNGIADIGDTEGGLENYDNDKLNDWVNQLMNDIVATNEAFNTLIKE